MTPNRKRDAVTVAVTRFGVSQRRACRLVDKANLFPIAGLNGSGIAVAKRMDRIVQRQTLEQLQFDYLLEAQVLIEDWRHDYNTNRSHTAHGDLTPTEFRI